MRYQELIYVQNDHNGVRNKDILNVNMSSDICTFQVPPFSISGSSKINCTGNTETYIISGDTTIPITFYFSGITSEVIDNNTYFKYEIYKYNTNANIFTIPAVYKSDKVSFI